ncbi:MAG TPA: hypothetical protein VEW25_13365 [Allosphingosinicella sp.]|nr:hypothetical protein [Allosphingosinicella sp.]
MQYAEGEEFELAEDLLREAKAIDPTYFECFKAEALLALSQNDWSRAISAYEAAIELAPDEFQLHFFFGGLLLRLNENDRAALEFEESMRLAGNDAILFREAARNELIRCNFTAAAKYLDQAEALGTPMSEKIKLVDLRVQLFGRSMEYHLRHDNFSDAEESVEQLRTYLNSIQRSDIDRKLVDHLVKYLGPLSVLGSRYPNGPARDVHCYILSLLSTSARSDAVGVGEVETHFGYMKEGGRKPSFAFLHSETCPDTYVHIADVPLEVWQWMVSGGAVEFGRLPGERGKAVYVKPVVGRRDEGR